MKLIVAITKYVRKSSVSFGTILHSCNLFKWLLSWNRGANCRDELGKIGPISDTTSFMDRFLLQRRRHKNNLVPLSDWRRSWTLTGSALADNRWSNLKFKHIGNTFEMQYIEECLYSDYNVKSNKKVLYSLHKIYNSNTHWLHEFKS